MQEQTKDANSLPIPIVTDIILDTDVGNGKRLADLYRTEIAYCQPLEEWFINNTRFWEIDTSGGIYRNAKATVRTIYDEGRNADTDRDRERLIRHALASEAKGRIYAMVELCKSEPGIAILPDRFDRDPMLFNLPNGTIDLRIGKLREHRVDDYITKISPVTYVLGATCPQWIVFLNTIFNNRPGLIKYIQKLCGYYLTGETKEEEFDIYHGIGLNGKSVFMEVLTYILGSYCIKANIETITANKNSDKGNAANPDVVVLKGARLVWFSEPEKGIVLREGRIKDFTGRDPITARPLFGKPITYKPEFKIAIVTNHKPIIKSVNKAMRRRTRLVPFEVTIPDDKIDKDLAAKLKAEAAGILNWMIEGCLLWQQEGLEPSEEVKAATEEYQMEMDWLGEFFESYCYIERNAEVSNDYLYNYVYKAWCEIHKINPISHISFPQMMIERGFTKKKTNKGIVYRGLKLDDEIVKRCKDLESQWGGATSDGVTVMTVFLTNFKKEPPHKDLCEKPSQPSQPSLNEFTDNSIQKSTEPSPVTVKPSLSDIDEQKECEKPSQPSQPSLLDLNSSQCEHFQKICDICGNPLNGNSEHGPAGLGLIHAECKYLPVPIQFLADTPIFAGIDQRRYGPFKVNQVEKIPATNAYTLIGRKVAVRAKER